MSDFLFDRPERKLPEGCELFSGDCFQIMPGWEDGSFDHVVSDPPYSAVTHLGARTNAGEGKEVHTLVDFACLTDDQFITLCRESVRLSRRWVIMTCDWRHAALAEQELPESFVRLGVWVKDDPAPQFTGDRPGTGWEAVLILHRPGKKKWNGGGLSSVWRFPVSRTKSHPTQKPLALYKRWVSLFTDPGDRVLDPFAGSGTTGLACLLEGRRAVLIEQDARHCETIRTRLDRPFPKPTPKDEKTGADLLLNIAKGKKSKKTPSSG